MSFLAYVKTRYKLIGWLFLGGIVMTYFACPSCSDSFNRYIMVSGFMVSIWIAMWLGNEYISIVLDEKFPWTNEPIKRMVIGLIAVILYSLSACYGLISFFRFFFKLNVDGTSQLSATVIIAVVITLFMTSRSFLFKWRQSAIDTEKLQKENIAAKYESLKNQVNPHFLFNSFNALTNLVYEDPDKAVKFIKQLSEVYRYVLDSREKEVVSLEEELKFLNSYIYLQKIRFGDKLIIDIVLPDTKGNVAPLALQMLLENAIKHNIVSEEEPLHVKLFRDDGFIAVENNLQKKTLLGESSMGVGLENICKRYEFLSNKKVEIIHGEKTFVVKLPELKENPL